MSPLEQAKQILRIPRLAEIRGWDWKPGKSCRVPYRPDRNESGSMLADGMLFHDFATGETIDAPALLQRMEDHLDPITACRLFIELAGGKSAISAQPPRPLVRVTTRKQSMEMPTLRKPSQTDIEWIAAQRGLGPEGVAVAANKGLVWLTMRHGFDCWALTDRKRCLLQGRRMDGAPFPKTGCEPYKAHSWKGSQLSWPLGILEAEHAPTLALVEGAGDFLAAWHFIVTQGAGGLCAPVAMLGGSCRIPEETWPFFRGKRVRIFAHVDEPKDSGRQEGYEAAARWEMQLTSAGAEPHTFDMAGLRQNDGKPVGDLNDLAMMSPEALFADAELSALMSF